MTLTEAKKKFVFTTKIELDGDFIILREPTLTEFQKFSDDGNKNLEIMKNLFPICVVDSSFTTDEEGKTKASGQQIYDVLSKSASTFTDIITNWFNACPFTSAAKKNKK